MTVIEIDETLLNCCLDIVPNVGSTRSFKVLVRFVKERLRRNYPNVPIEGTYK